MASDGPAADCVVDKIQEFAAKLGNPGTDPEEQVVALTFLLHFVGDPLHSSDDNDRGGDDKKVSANGFKAGNAGTQSSSPCLKPMRKASPPT